MSTGIGGLLSRSTISSSASPAGSTRCSGCCAAAAGGLTCTIETLGSSSIFPLSAAMSA
jgi:hypothetical protein